MDKNNTLLVIDGGTVKTEENGIATGLAIVFGSPADPDQSAQRDFFTSESFIMKKNKFEVPLYHNHGFPVKEQIGEAILVKEESGWRAEAKIDLTSDLGKQIYEEVKTKPYGFSTGALSHLVVREAKENNTNFLKNWVVGELSLTPRPAERKAVVQAVKSLDGELFYEDAFDEAKGVSGATNLPLASRDRTWDSGAAKKRIKEWAGVKDKANADYKKAFFWWDGENPDNLTSGKLPFADVVDGTLTAIPKGIFAAAQRLDSTDISDSDKDGVKRKIASYYTKMKNKFDDEEIVVPWSKMAEKHKDETDGATLIALYDENGEKIWDSEDGTEAPTPDVVKRIEIKQVSGSVTYELYHYDEEKERGTQISMYQWGGMEDFMGRMQEMLNEAHQAMKGKTEEEVSLEEKINKIVKSMLPETSESEQVSELKTQLQEVSEKLAQAELQVSDSENKLTEANKRIEQLQILADANKTIQNVKGNK